MSRAAKGELVTKQHQEGAMPFRTQPRLAFYKACMEDNRQFVEEENLSLHPSQITTRYLFEGIEVDGRQNRLTWTLIDRLLEFINNIPTLDGCNICITGDRRF